MAAAISGRGTDYTVKFFSKREKEELAETLKTWDAIATYHVNKFYLDGGVFDVAKKIIGLTQSAFDKLIRYKMTPDVPHYFVLCRDAEKKIQAVATVVDRESHVYLSTLIANPMNINHSVNRARVSGAGRATIEGIAELFEKEIRVDAPAESYWFYKKCGFQDSGDIFSELFSLKLLVEKESKDSASSGTSLAA